MRNKYLERCYVRKCLDIQNYNCAYYFVWVLNLVAHFEGGT